MNGPLHLAANWITKKEDFPVAPEAFTREEHKRNVGGCLAGVAIFGLIAYGTGSRIVQSEVAVFSDGTSSNVDVATRTASNAPWSIFPIGAAWATLEMTGYGIIAARRSRELTNEVVHNHNTPQGQIEGVLVGDQA